MEPDRQRQSDSRRSSAAPDGAGRDRIYDDRGVRRDDGAAAHDTAGDGTEIAGRHRCAVGVTLRGRRHGQSQVGAAAAPEAGPAPLPLRPEAPVDTTRIPSPSGDTGDDHLDWTWPAKGKVVTGFSDTANLKGIDIAGKAGDPVYASAAGKVVYAGSGLRGYGKLIIIKHNKTYLSAYAHNREILVKEGQQVAQGQKIAEMGNTDTDQVKLHFEIRRLGKPMDPARYLPPA